MIALRYAQYTERAVGENHPTKEDTVNRALKDLIENSGLGSAAGDIAFLTSVDLTTVNAAIAAEIAARIADVDTEETARIAADNTLTTALAAKQNLLVRADVGVTTASIADLVTEDSTIVLGKSGLLYRGIASAFCRVRLYSTATARTADTARAIGTDPATAAGVLADLVFDATSGLTINFQPLISFNNNDVPVTSTIYYAITNRSGTPAAITVTFTRMVLES